MTDLAVISTPGALDQYADPGEFVILACERARDWLREAINKGDIEQIGEIKSQAEAVRVYTTQKQYGHDAELAAAEIVRRAERGIGLSIRRGQDEGSIAKRGSQDLQDGEIVPVQRAAQVKHPSELTRIYELTDGVTDDQFDAAIHDTKVVDGDLSRANVKRAVARQKIGEDFADPSISRSAVEARANTAREMAATGSTSRQIAAAIGIESMAGFRKRHGIEVPADTIVGRRRRLNSERVVTAAVTAVDGIGFFFDEIDYDALPADKFDGWVSVLNDAIKSLKTLRDQLKERRPQP